MISHLCWGYDLYGFIFLKVLSFKANFFFFSVLVYLKDGNFGVDSTSSMGNLQFFSIGWGSGGYNWKEQTKFCPFSCIGMERNGRDCINEQKNYKMDEILSSPLSCNQPPY